MKRYTTAAGLAVVAVLAVVGSAIFIYSGAYDVAATSEQSRLTEWLLNTTMHRSVTRRADGVEVPDLDDDDMRLAGVGDFDAMCAGCHTAPGAEPSPMAQGLNPPPPDLSHSAEELTPEELFWITKNGIRMTGMPAWAPTHRDEDLWGVVAFIRAMPGLSGEEYQEMLEAAEGHGHHAADADDHGHDESGSDAEATEHAGEADHTDTAAMEAGDAEEHPHVDDGHAH